MEFKWLLIPVFGQILLTFLLLWRLAFLRIKAVTSGTVKMENIALGQKKWPERVMQVDRCFHNQLETPILLYALVALIGVCEKNDGFFVVLASLFLISRLGHAFEHTRLNRVRLRLIWFAGGTMALTIMWIYFATLIF